MEPSPYIRVFRFGRCRVQKAAPTDIFIFGLVMPADDGIQ